MKPQSVLTRVKMFENKRSVSLESKKDENHTAGFKVSARPCLSCRPAWHVQRFAATPRPRSLACDGLFQRHLCLIFCSLQR